MYQLDKKDFRILFELDRNSRFSIKNIAKKTGLSRDVVAYRIKQLEKNEIIKKYITIIDFSKFGLQIIRLYLKLQNTTPAIEESIVDFFVKQQNTLTVYKTDGYYDIAIGFLIKDIHSYQLVYEKFLAKFRKYIAKKDFSIFLDYLHFHRNYLVEKKYHDFVTLSTGSFKPFKYNLGDIKILNLIKENARASLLDLAKKLRITATGVKYKLKNLEKNKVIVAYKLLLDYAKLGYSYYKVDLQLEDTSIIPALNQFIINHPNVIYKDIAVGGSDFEFDCELKSQEDFYKLIDEIKTLFPKKIRNYFYYKARKIYKYSYFPIKIEQNA